MSLPLCHAVNKEISAFGTVNGNRNNKDGFWVYFSPSMRDTIKPCLYSCGYYKLMIHSHINIISIMILKDVWTVALIIFDSVAVKTSQIINLQEGFDTKIIVSTHTEIVQYILIALAVIVLGVSIGYYGEKKFFLSP